MINKYRKNKVMFSRIALYKHMRTINPISILLATAVMSANLAAESSQPRYLKVM